MLARLRKAQGNEAGFTLIELLVVIIIIGILAAIAIPTFLRQREKGYISAMKADLKNAATAQESYATEAQGAYTNDEAALTSEGYNASPSVTVVVDGLVANPASFSLCATHTNVAGKYYRYSSTTGAITTNAVACVAV